MARGRAVTAERLAALGAPRLAAMLTELAEADPVIRRMLALELTSQAGPGELADAVGKRLATVARARGRLGDRALRDLAEDLSAQLRAITTGVAPAQPGEAVELLWRLLELLGGVIERGDEDSGRLAEVAARAVEALGAAALAACAAPEALAACAASEALAARICRGLLGDAHGVMAGLIAALAPALGPGGLAELGRQLLDLQANPPPVPPPAQQRRVGWSTRGPIMAHELEAAARRRTLSLALQEVADARGDADAFTAEFSAEQRRIPRVAAEIAARLTEAGRAAEALAALDAAVPRRLGWSELLPPEFDWHDARIAALTAAGRMSEAQDMRWACFEQTLSPVHLRDHLKRLADFDDVEAEARAFAHAATFRPFEVALDFLIRWPALEPAAAMVLARRPDLDGRHYAVLAPAAEALAGRHPLAATVLLRALIDFALANRRAARYRHAARHLRDCAGLAGGIADFAGEPAHEAYVAGLRAVHGSKAAFWALATTA
jgi:hypothetical protein